MPLPVYLLLLLMLNFYSVVIEVSTAELTEKAGCSVRRELLSVVCQSLNSSALIHELQNKLEDPVPTGEYSSAPWVHELKVFDGRMPVLATVAQKNTPALGGLKLLEVVRCQIRQVRIEAMMEVAGSLRLLSLAHNKLVSIPAALSILDKLEVLDLRHNAITRLTPLLARLSSLRHLKLDHNRIRQVTGWGRSPKAPQLSSLTQLSLSNNLVHEVWDEALSGLHALQNLDLSNNLLQRLPRTLDFPPRLIEFDIRENPWHCDCGAAWLSNLQLKTDPNALLIFLPSCSSPQHLRNQPLASLSTFELCSGWANVNGTRTMPRDIENHHMQISQVDSTSFELTWNVSDISQRGKKIQEYLGWRVTFRKFGENEEGEVLLITLAGEEAVRKTGTSSGRYTVRHLTPATGYLVCFQTLTDNEINNIIESQKVNRVTPFPSPSLDPKGRSLEAEGNQSSVFHDEWGSVLADEIVTSATAEFVETTTTLEITDPTIEEESFTTEKAEVPVIQAQRFVYTNTGDRIPINFGSPGSPTHPIFPESFNHPSLENFNEHSSSTNNRSPIRNVPPPPPPPSFVNSEQKFPFPFFRTKRSLELPSAPDKRRCVEVTTEEEDEITMPVTVAATASSSTTMVILMICCCCFPKKCNRMRDCCINKCKSMGNQTLVKTTSKTKTFVRPPKTEEKKILSKSISISTPNLRTVGSYENISEYQYHKLNKYYTMRGKELDKVVIKFFPGYDLPKTAAAKYFGYDFPKIQNVSEAYSKIYPNYDRRLSTDDNTSPVNIDRFIYSNLNGAEANLNIPIDQCKYSNRIKGITYSPLPKKRPQPTEFEHYKKPMYIVPKKVLKHSDGISTASLNREKMLLPRSLSTPDLKSMASSDNHEKRLYHNIFCPVTSMEDKIRLQNNPAYDLPIQVGKPAKVPLETHQVKLEVVRQFVQPTPKRPSLLNISGVQNSSEGLNGYVAHPSPDLNKDLYYAKPKPHRPDKSKDNIQLYQLPKGSESKPSALPHSRNTGPLPVGEVAVTGGTLVEVPEGYVFPSKPRPINVLRLKVPADPASFSEA
ncbi:Fibronectin type III [Trinorchestia longiramus]|nr:Fibronectin type III [Trinorchestia longiramus]